MFRNIILSGYNEKILQSYLGLISHGNTYKLRKEILIKPNRYSYSGRNFEHHLGSVESGKNYLGYENHMKL